MVRCLQEICTYYGMEDRCAPVDWQSTITVRNWAAESVQNYKGINLVTHSR